MIDGVSVRTLFDDPTIGLTFHFDLTAGDSASFTSVFDVQPVPEPGTALLMGLGLAGLPRRRKA